MPPGLSRRILRCQALRNQFISTGFDVKFQFGIQIAIQSAAPKCVRQA
jgi:hypothetical protein